jgi:hypothetical protein
MGAWELAGIKQLTSIHTTAHLCVLVLFLFFYNLKLNSKFLGTGQLTLYSLFHILYACWSTRLSSLFSECRQSKERLGCLHWRRCVKSDHWNERYSRVGLNLFKII